MSDLPETKPSETEQFIKNLFTRFPDLGGVVITAASDGITIIEEYRSSDLKVTKPSLALTASIAAERVGKLTSGLHSSIVCTYPSYHVVHSVFHPLILTLIGTGEYSASTTTALADTVRQALEPLRAKIESLGYHPLEEI
eukprot:TRINITY_DN5988_c0_g1_i1.p1 TRINITY_DN5988_c0_g1~~TRINITY_DN5988_c0_g1_i1.p1  ORF type:complete len:140 (+),score=10.33 TRINITY_DN5988_c0_g1_i1:159-578(+)